MRLLITENNVSLSRFCLGVKKDFRFYRCIKINSCFCLQLSQNTRKRLKRNEFSGHFSSSDLGQYFSCISNKPTDYLVPRQVLARMWATTREWHTRRGKAKGRWAHCPQKAVERGILVIALQQSHSRALLYLTTSKEGPYLLTLF